MSSIVTLSPTSGKNNLFTGTHHGFRRRRSCETQLLLTINDRAKGSDGKQPIDAVLIDFSNAFDKVPHQRLLLKLKHYGVKWNLLGWIGDFLSTRTQEVAIDGAKSLPSPVTSVQQCTVFGPFLFLAYINDMPERVTYKIKLFSDDSLLYRKGQRNSDCQELQEELDRLQEWERKWQMSFNADKCEVLQITNKHHPISADFYSHNQKLAVKTDAKYPWVTISSDLSWGKHTDNITKKANSTMPSSREM